MFLDIHELDRLEFGSDDYQENLDFYLDNMAGEFAESSVGRVYCQGREEWGQWIYHFVGKAYVYEGFTPPRMTKREVEIVMEETLPRKITLRDRSDAIGAVPELIALWQFLQDDYDQPNAAEIITYLEQIEHKFPDWMVDPARGGMAKQFFMGGIASGFDMSTEEGMLAYQMAYNQQLLGGSLNSSLLGAPPKKKKAKPNTKGFAAPKPQSKSKSKKKKR